MAYLSSIILFLIPVLFLAFFIVSLVLYISAVRKNKKVPGLYTKPQLTARKVLLITSSCLAGLMLTFVIAIVALMFMVVAYM